MTVCDFASSLDYIFTIKKKHFVHRIISSISDSVKIIVKYLNLLFLYFSHIQANFLVNKTKVSKFQILCLLLVNLIMKCNCEIHRESFLLDPFLSSSIVLCPFCARMVARTVHLINKFIHSFFSELFSPTASLDFPTFFFPLLTRVIKEQNRKKQKYVAISSAGSTSILGLLNL